MTVLVLGSGGREHALAWKLAQGPEAATVVVAPGNGGTPLTARVDPMDFHAVESYCLSHGIDLVVVGPEAPLVAGIVDHFEGSPVRVVGPGREGARLEGSKIWAKRFMERHEVATAPFWVVGPGTDPMGLVRHLGGRLVVK